MKPTTTEIFTDLDDYCPRCSEREITNDGVCRNCGLKCWHPFH